ncbi:uncharacterized protein LOC129581773 isoform X1 [Paramacrobiotus metropolitanus]|uniref:uncharacterized protein LOC129581773 isoform X1 n=1 Tax=Paramacrobiotus metropolitanus TaxID=2943436 RepID=UPI00244572EA|nr:uncharacterized protein LOC129581773 isoform X1 [Paramacrobiotus metropolitanus]XP_055328979.1 uncharacterized protein LOC129581773 isoform X1 [Paramacrobiotus metropolitanus]
MLIRMRLLFVLILMTVAAASGIDLQSTSGLQLEAREHKPPFGAMQPASVNPVASLPIDSSNNITSSPLVRNRRQGLAGLEIAKDHNKDESYPKSTVVAEYTVTHTPLDHLGYRRRREGREHDFFLAVAPNTTDTSAAGKNVQPLSQRSRRQTEEEGTIAAAGEPSHIAVQPTPFHTDVTLVPVDHHHHEFVDPSDSTNEGRIKHRDKTVLKRQVDEHEMTRVPVTRRRTTTTTLGWLKRIQQDTSSGQSSRSSGASGGIQTPPIPLGAI